MDGTRFDRREFKFVVDAAQRQALRASLVGRMQPDPHGDLDGRYPVVSVYYDSPELDLFLAGLRGQGSRRKLRLRLYGDRSTRSGTACFVEIKHRYGSRVGKRRLALPLEEALALCSGRRPPGPLSAEDRRVADEVLRMQAELALGPRCVMRYDRQAFRGLGPEADLRLTFDSGLRSRARDFQPRPGDRDFDRTLLEPELAILEIKVARRVPYWLARRVGQLGCVRRPYSKYNTAVQALGLHPALDAARPPLPTREPVRARLEALETPWTP